jgi:hypothetical protein
LQISPRPFALALLFTVSSPAMADPPAREIRLEIYGEDACPEPEGDEIVVCARRPEEERYRIPPRLRERPERRVEASWGARVEAMEDATRFTRPNSCSVVGSNGQTGCTAAMIRDWFASRRGR